MAADWLDEIHWNGDGLVPAIAQEARTGRILMLAWMNRESLARTAESGEAVYWSRSRSRLWRKGEESGHVQRVKEIRLDCDADAVLLRRLRGFFAAGPVGTSTGSSTASSGCWYSSSANAGSGSSSGAAWMSPSCACSRSKFISCGSMQIGRAHV